MRRTGAGRPTEPTEASGPPAAGADEGGGLREAVRTTLLANYPAVQYHYVQFLAEHLTDCRKTLGGDFDDLMMLAVLGQRFLQARRDRDAGDGEAEARVWMSALRLSDVTGVPRESVRRKLIRLAARGWVTQDPARGWRLAGSFEMAQARVDLGDLDRRGIDRLARLVAALMPFLSNQPEAPVDPDSGDLRRS